MALRAIGSETLTIDDTAGGIGFTAAELTDKVIRAVCKNETGEIRVQTSPPGDVVVTAGGTEGSPTIAIDGSFKVIGMPDMLNFRAIRTGATSGSLHVVYEGEG